MNVILNRVLFESWMVAAACAVLMLACWQFAFRIHRRSLASLVTQEPSGGLIDEACLAILGLLLAFTFAAAFAKYENRNTKAAEDANALRALHLRAELLPDPWRKELDGPVRALVSQRLELTKPGFNEERILTLYQEVMKTETQILTVIRRMNQDKEASSYSSSVSDALSAVIVSRETRVAAGSEQVPPPVIGLLILVAGICSYLLGRSQGITGKLRRATIPLILLVSAILYVTMDLEQPARGLIPTNQAPIIRLAQSMGITS